MIQAVDPVMNLLITGGAGFIGCNLIRHVFGNPACSAS